MTECIAATCSRDLRDNEIAVQLLCTPCLSRLRGWLHSIPAQMVVLREGSMQREVTGGIGRSGTRTPPLPGRLDTLTLLGPWASQPVRGHRDDQCDDIVVAETLYGWVRVVCEERRLDGPVAMTEEALAEWLDGQLSWMARQHWIDDAFEEFAIMMRAIWGITRLHPQTRAVSRPCPNVACDKLTLIQRDWGQYVECTSCERLWTVDELNLDAVSRMAKPA